MSFQSLLSATNERRDEVDLYDDLARAALAEGEEEAALDKILPAAERLSHPLLWQWSALLQRSIDEHEAAIRSFERATALAPNDPLIAHAHARCVLEAGLDAVEHFLQARALAPSDPDVLLGLAAARNAVGEGALAADELDAILQRAPGWTHGHEQLAQLRCTIGQRERATASLEAAIARFPREAGLWSSLFRVAIQAADYVALERYVNRAAAAGLTGAPLMTARAIAAAELDPAPFPVALFEASPELSDQLAVWRIRHLLKAGEIGEASKHIDQELRSPRAMSAWPYAAVAWRLAGDSRSEWLEGENGFAQTFDLSADLPALEQLGETLRNLHVARAEYLDQSVRGGTQTDGPLFTRIDPVIRRLRAAVVKAVQAYVANLPPLDPAHPLLSHRRDRRVRFSGSWSVRLRGGGRHANHVHPQGWISSALYVSLPERVAGEPGDAGWFTLGEPDPALGLDLPPRLKVEPEPGKLVLFPSWMWHGTVPFAEGERLTVAFDVRPPI